MPRAVAAQAGSRSLCAVRARAGSLLLHTTQSPRNAAQGFRRRRQHPFPVYPLSNPQAPGGTLGPLGAPHSGVGASCPRELPPSLGKCDLGRPPGVSSPGALRMHFWKGGPDTGAADGSLGLTLPFSRSYQGALPPLLLVSPLR